MNESTTKTLPGPEQKDKTAHLADNTIGRNDGNEDQKSMSTETKTCAQFIPTIFIFLLFFVALYPYLSKHQQKTQAHLGNFYLDVQSKPRECVRLHNRLGDHRQHINLAPSSEVSTWVEPQIDFNFINLPYCQKLWVLLRKCFLKTHWSNSFLGSNFIDHKSTTTSANLNQYHPNILLIVSNPRAERPDIFLDLFLTHFLQNYQVKLNRTIRHAPTLSCHSFISAYDLQDRKDPANSIIVYGPQTFGVHSILDPLKPYLYILWVEHPIERVWRLYLSQKNDPSSGKKPISSELNDEILNHMSESSNMSQFLSDSRLSQNPYIDNYLTRLLSFDIGSDNPICNSGRQDCLPQNTYRYQNRFEKIGQSHFKIATKVIESHSVFVVLASEPEKSLKRICLHFNMSSSCFGKSALRRLQKSSRLSEEEKEQLESQDLETHTNLEARNEWDLKLYEFLRNVFHEQTKY